MSTDTIMVILLSLGLGLLVGIQRERQAHQVAGVRTFVLITVLGSLVGLLSQDYGHWMLAVGALALLGVLAIGNWKEVRLSAAGGPGVTTEIAALVMFFVGGALAAGHTAVAITTAGLLAVLLQWKAPLHGLADRIGKQEFRAITQLALIALVVLPMLPNRSFGPYDVLNPFQIWLMVVLIVGLSLASYIAFRLIDARRGALVGGMLGGMISSTATTVSYARQSRTSSNGVVITALVIFLASTVLNVRILIEIGLVAPSLVRTFLPPFAMIGLLMVFFCGLLYFRAPRESPMELQPENPGQLKTALTFGALYAVILLAVAAAKEHFGESGIYMVAMVSGLTDVDALTLSIAELVSRQRLEADTAWRVVMTGTMSNLLFKLATVAVLGSRKLLAYMALLFGMTLLAGILLLLFLPPITFW